MKTAIRWLVFGGVAVALSGCRQQDVRTFRVHLAGAEGTNDFERIRGVLIRLEGVQPDSIRFFEVGEVELRYDSMKLARKNIEYAIAGAGYGANEIPAGQVPEEQRRRTP